MCCPAAVVCCNVIALAHSVCSLASALVVAPFQSVLLPPRLENKLYNLLPAFGGGDLKTKTIAGVILIRIYPARRRAILLLLVDESGS